MGAVDGDLVRQQFQDQRPGGGIAGNFGERFKGQRMVGQDHPHPPLDRFFGNVVIDGQAGHQSGDVGRPSTEQQSDVIPRFGQRQRRCIVQQRAQLADARQPAGGGWLVGVA